MAEYEHILNLNDDQLKILATSKGITFASSITKPELQILVLTRVNKSSEQSVIQAKLQLVYAEKQKAKSEKQKAEAAKLKLDADFEYQSKLIRLRHEDSERKRDEAERDARIAQELEARKREEAERDARIAQEPETRKRDEVECDFALLKSSRLGSVKRRSGILKMTSVVVLQ